VLLPCVPFTGGGTFRDCSRSSTGVSASRESGLQFLAAAVIMHLMRMRSSRVQSALVGAILLAVTVGCGQQDNLPPEKRTFVNPDTGYRYVVPPQWEFLRGEVKSPGGSLFSVQTLSLIGGDETFIADLPYSMVPQLEEWARYFFSVEGSPVMRRVTLDGEQALEVTYRIRIRPVDPQSKVVFLVARKGDNVFILKMTYAPGMVEQDEEGARALVSSWRFGEARPTAPPGSIVVATPATTPATGVEP